MHARSRPPSDHVEASGSDGLRANTSSAGHPPVSAEARALQARARDLIPGGSHTYSKGDDQYPLIAPPFLERGSGCHVWDYDGNRYVEYGMGLRSVTLGHAHASVNAAAFAAMQRGQNFTRPSTLELVAAERLSALAGPGQMVKFAKNGSDVTTAAVKLARAWTGRDLVAICADHPFFSTDDWFIGATPLSAGVPRAIQDLTVGFHYNDLDGLRHLFESRRGEIACLIMEAETSVAPVAGYLAGVQALCREHGAVFILDEMITGFRWDLGGAQRVYGIEPDLSTFGKGMANGFSVSALVGRGDIMELGGLTHARDRVFLLSTTHGAEHGGLGAAIETMRIYRDEPVIETLGRRGTRLRQGVSQAARAHGVESHVQVVGHPANLVFVTRDASGQTSRAFRALFMQELIRGGVIGPSFVVSYAHTDDDIDFTIAAADRALGIYRRALDDGVERYLEGPALKPVFRARN
jgi:glutamate-1-semialdehyde 2,1-aminomutase